MESRTTTPIYSRFQVNKCPFGDKYKCRYIKDPNFTPRDNNGADKKKFTSKMPHKKFTPCNNDNRLLGPPRGKPLDGQAPTCSVMQISTLKLLAYLNTVNKNDDSNIVIISNNVPNTSNFWMFDNNSSTSTNKYGRICTFNYSSSSSSSTSSSSALTYDQRTAHIWNYDILQSHVEQKIVKYHDIAAAHEICRDFRRKVATYSESDFRVNMFTADTSFPLARHVIGPHNTRTLTALGWTDDIKILNATIYPVHVQNNTPEFMTALYNTGRIWLGAATILPPKHIHDPDSPCVFDPDNFSTFRPKCTRYNPPGAPSPYVSRFTSHT